LKAIVVSGNWQASRRPGTGWGALSPIVDRPFLQHVVETIVGQGIRDLYFVLRGDDLRARAMLGDGTRWGARFRYDAPAGGEHVYDVLRQIAMIETDESLLLAHADRLPLLQSDATTCPPTLFCWRRNELRWTGWGVIRAADILRFPQGIEEREMFAFLTETGDIACVEGPRPLTAHSYEDLIEANRRVLAREFPDLLVSGKEVQPGVWVARNVTVHPTAKLTSPAFLGENSRVGALVQVGPAASIGRDCMIERETSVLDSVVCGGSYVGQQLALRGVVVDRSRLINTRWDAEIEDVDELLLGSVYGAPLNTQLQRLCGRLAAASMLILASPCLFVALVASAAGVVPALRREFMVRTPTVSEGYRWKLFPMWSFGERQVADGRVDWSRHFFFCFLPALWPIAAGKMSFAGNRPRTKEQGEQLPEAGRSAFLRSPSGILQSSSSTFLEADSGLAGLEGTEPSWRETVTRCAQYAGLVLRSCLFGKIE
jgi:acetyltransferase-like isoleucine patch superfamily enzyme